jgi:hypothetical protein
MATRRFPPPWSIDDIGGLVHSPGRPFGHEKNRPNWRAVSIRHSQTLRSADIGNRDLARPAVFLSIEGDFLAFG